MIKFLNNYGFYHDLQRLFFYSAIFVDLFRHQLELPGVYSQLQAFYNDKKGVLPDSASSLVVSPASTPSTPSSLLPEMKVQNSPI